MAKLSAPRGTPVTIFIAFAWLLSSLPLYGAIIPERFGMTKGESRTFPINIDNTCPRATKFRLKIKGLELARAPKKVRVPPASVKTIDVVFDTSKSKKRQFEGSIRLTCVNCVQKRCNNLLTVFPVKIRVLDFESLLEKANQFAESAGLEVRLVKLSVDSSVSEENLKASAEKLVRHTVFLGAAEEGSGGDDETMAAELIAHGLVRPGQFLARATWQRDDGTSFTTLAASDEDGNLTYEPVLHFSSVENRRQPEPRRGSWTWGPWKLSLDNFFGNCVDVSWEISIHSSGCTVEDPGPHFVSMVSKPSPCFGWSEVTHYGEVPWCRSNAECRAGCAAAAGAHGESCIKWGVVTYVTHGLSRLDVDSGRPGSLDGIPLQATVDVHRGLFGQAAVYKTVCSLCALSGGLLPCSATKE